MSGVIWSLECTYIHTIGVIHHPGQCTNKWHVNIKHCLLRKCDNHTLSKTGELWTGLKAQRRTHWNYTVYIDNWKINPMYLSVYVCARALVQVIAIYEICTNNVADAVERKSTTVLLLVWTDTNTHTDTNTLYTFTYM